MTINLPVRHRGYANGLGIAADKVDTAAHAQTAITDITNAVQSLGLVQGASATAKTTCRTPSAWPIRRSPTNRLPKNIRDANVAQEAAKLTSSQVLQQSSVAALAQANAEPQALLKLLA